MTSVPITKKKKKSQYIMNNAINEIKNTLEATNSRITEAEDRISELEDRMVEINESERKKEKRIKRRETDPASNQFPKCSPPSGTHRNSQSWVE